MPYSSKRQARFMHVRHPAIAARWDKEFPSQTGLPERAVKRKGKKLTRRDIRRQQMVAQFAAKQRGKHG